MPLSVFRKLGLGEVTPTTISLQMADRSLTYPRGIIEDVLVKVDKFIFPVDFVVLDMEEDREIPIILGRPFLATGRALIDVHSGNLTLRVNEEEVNFNIFDSLKFPSEGSSCNRVEVVELCTKEFTQELLSDDSLEHSLTNSLAVENWNDEYCSKREEVLDCVLALGALPGEATSETHTDIYEEPKGAPNPTSQPQGGLALK